MEKRGWGSYVYANQLWSKFTLGVFCLEWSMPQSYELPVICKMDIISIETEKSLSPCCAYHATACAVLVPIWNLLKEIPLPKRNVALNYHRTYGTWVDLRKHFSPEQPWGNSKETPSPKAKTRKKPGGYSSYPVGKIARVNLRKHPIPKTRKNKIYGNSSHPVGKLPHFNKYVKSGGSIIIMFK